MSISKGASSFGFAGKAQKRCTRKFRISCSPTLPSCTMTLQQGQVNSRLLCLSSEHHVMLLVITQRQQLWRWNASAWMASVLACLCCRHRLFYIGEEVMYLHHLRNKIQELLVQQWNLTVFFLLTVESHQPSLVQGDSKLKIKSAGHVRTTILDFKLLFWSQHHLSLPVENGFVCLDTRFERESPCKEEGKAL